MSENIEITTKECSGCGVEFDSRTFIVCGVRMNFDKGYCPACREQRLAEYEEREQVSRLASIATKRREWRYSCGIPPLFMTKEFGNFNQDSQTQAYNKCVKYAEDFPLDKVSGYPSLLLFSEKVWGIGKTHLVASIAHRILNRWGGEDTICPVLFITEPDLFRRIQATYNIPQEDRVWHETEDDVFNQLGRVALLVLDDIGKTERADSRFVQRTLFSIIDRRTRLESTMVLTTNLNPQQLNTYLGGDKSNEATYDRIVEMCQGKFIRMSGESYRRRKVAE